MIKKSLTIKQIKRVKDKLNLNPEINSSAIFDWDGYIQSLYKDNLLKKELYIK